MPTNFDPYSYHIHTTFAGRVAYMEFCFFFKGISKNNRQTCELWICVPVWAISAAILLEGWCIRSASSVEWVLIETKQHNCQRQQYLEWRFPMGSIPKYMFKFGWFGVTPFEETFILAAQTGHRRVVLISRHCSAWISLACGPAGLDMERTYQIWRNFRRQMTMCRPLAVVVGCLFLKPHFGHLPVSHRHPETTCFATVSCEHEIQTIMFVVFMPW